MKANFKDKPQYGKQHYIPQTYTKWFANQKNQVAVFDKDLKKTFTTNIKNLFSENHFFSLDNAQEAAKYYNIEINEYCVDEELKKHENKLSGILRLVNEFQTFDQIGRDDVIFLIEAVAWFNIAHPDTREILINRNPDYSNTQVCAGFIDWHKKIEPAFFTKNWGLAVCENDLLISTDRPVIITTQLESPKDVVGLTNGTIMFSLTPNLLLLGKPNANRRFQIMKPKILDRNYIDLFNSIAFAKAKNYVFTRNHATLSAVVLKFF